MCFSAIHWARIGRIIYGTAIKDADRVGFNELKISSLKIKALGKSKTRIIKGFMLSECLRLLKDWDVLANKRLY